MADRELECECERRLFDDRDQLLLTDQRCAGDQWCSLAEPYPDDDGGTAATAGVG